MCLSLWRFLSRFKGCVMLKKFFPVGYYYQQEITIYCSLLVVSILYSLTTINRIYDWANTYRLNHRAVVPDYIDICGFSLYGFFIVVIFSVVMIRAHYHYHYVGTKSIYIMKRINHPNELHRRCLAAPLIEILISIVLMFVLNYIYFAIYRAVLPPESINPNQLIFYFL